MKNSYIVIRDLVIIVLLIMVIYKQNQILSSDVESNSFPVETLTVNDTITVSDTTFILDTIIVPIYKTKVNMVSKIVTDTITITNTNTNTITVLDTVKVIITDTIHESVVKLDLPKNTFVYDYELYKLDGNKLYVLYNDKWIKPNKLKSNRGKLTPHRLNKEYLSQVQDLIKSQNTLADN